MPLGTPNMLSAISFVANDEAERTLKAEKKERKKEKKRLRKVWHCARSQPASALVGQGD